jgi:hypothetical protein
VDAEAGCILIALANHDKRKDMNDLIPYSIRVSMVKKGRMGRGRNRDKEVYGIIIYSCALVANRKREGV